LLPSTLHLLLFEFLFANGDVPVAGSFVKLPATPLAKYPIVFFLVLLLLLHLSASATSALPACTTVTDILGRGSANSSPKLHAL